MRFISCALAIMLSVAVSHATVVNGDFSHGGTGWATVGGVQFNGSTALIDDSTAYNVLYQIVQLNAGDYTYRFSLNSTLGGGVPSFVPVAGDSLVASLYFINDLGSLDPANPIFDQTTHFVTQTGPVQTGQQDFVFNFTNNYQYVFAAFELFNGNSAQDSRVLVDNVSIDASDLAPIVPEPATLMLVGCGLAGMAARMRRRTH